MIACFVITSDENGQVWCGSCSTIILVKVGHFPVFLRHRGDIQVMLVPYGLEDVSQQIRYKRWHTDLKVPTNNEQIDTIPPFHSAGFFYRSINSMKCPMSLYFDSQSAKSAHC